MRSIRRIRRSVVVSTLRSGENSGRTDEPQGTGALIVDSHQRTNVPGLYAAGDVVLALNQIAVAYSGAATAATEIHNSLPRIRA